MKKFRFLPRCTRTGALIPERAIPFNSHDGVSSRKFIFSKPLFRRRSTVPDDVCILKYKTMKMATNDARMVQLVCNSVLHRAPDQQ